MKIHKICFVLLLLAIVTNLTAQDIRESAGRNSDLDEQNAVTPCLTDRDYALLEQEVSTNLIRLGLQPGTKKSTDVASVSLGWPLEADPSLRDCSYYHVSAYVDQDTLPGTFRDWNCGTDTYNGHRGTDISTWPFNFHKMDNDLVKVVAAAPGTIIAKHDGEFDRNCTGNNLTANYIMIQHGDGSSALYWHMKNGSVTQSPVGATVAAGEYLGVVGSSGSSSGPHLHFEVWAGSVVATRIDPFSGSCNALNPTTWWAAQRDYKETAIMRASAHTTDIVMPPCPTTETLNEGASFTIPFQGAGLPAGYAKFYVFFREETAGLTADMSILDPQGSTYLNWNYVSSSSNEVRVQGWSKVLPTTSGTYTFRATYNGVTCESTFDIVGIVGAQEAMGDGIRIYPNPTHGSLTAELASYQDGLTFEMWDFAGQKVFEMPVEGKQQRLDLPSELRGLHCYRFLRNGVSVASGRVLVAE
ncbi:MAG: M23 family metallopeptidase [Bacteroidetes bacterium]|nr:M23 family metallopeptidase [Bacteroidota bacterium]